MYQYGARGQETRDPVFDASGTITTGGTPQLILPERRATTWLTIQNQSTGALWVEFGSARATCAIISGAISSYSITNAGFNFTHPPRVVFYGGGYGGNTARLPVGLPGYPSPGDASDPPGYHPAKAHAVLTSGAVSSIVTENAGSGYGIAPLLFMFNSHIDPFGCADPSVGSGSGFQLPASGGSITIDSNFMTTDAIAIYGATTGQAFTVKWAP